MALRASARPVQGDPPHLLQALPRAGTLPAGLSQRGWGCLPQNITTVLGGVPEPDPLSNQPSFRGVSGLR